MSRELASESRIDLSASRRLKRRSKVEGQQKSESLEGWEVSSALERDAVSYETLPRLQLKARRALPAAVQ